MRVSRSGDGSPERPTLPHLHPSEAMGTCVQMVATGLWVYMGLVGPCPCLEASLAQVSLRQTPLDSSPKVQRGGVVRGGRGGFGARAPADSSCCHLFLGLCDRRQIPTSWCLGLPICKCNKAAKALGSINAGVSPPSWGKPRAWSRGRESTLKGEEKGEDSSLAWRKRILGFCIIKTLHLSSSLHPGRD